MKNLIASLIALCCLCPPSELAAKAGRPKKPPEKTASLPSLPEPLEKPLSGDSLKASIHRLDNGLTLYLSPNPQQPRITAWIAVRAGSKHDPADSTGLAHYLEHMLFKGTTRLGTLDYGKEKPRLDRIQALYEKHFKTQDPQERAGIYQEIDRENVEASRYAVPNEQAQLYRQMGFRGLNAFTSEEATVYICDMPKNRAEAWARTEAARFADPVFRLFQGELETVYEEKNRAMDDADQILIEALNKKLYKIHPYGQQPTIGTIEHLKNPSLAQMYAYYRRHYVPGNMAITLSGDFERGEMLALLKRHFGAWSPKPPPPARAWELPLPKGRELVEVKYEAEEKVIVSWPTVPRLHPDADALAVMDMLVDNAAAGIMNLTLNQAQRVKASGSYPSFYNDAGDWSVWAVPKKAQSLEEAEALLLEAVEKLKAGDFTPEDIKAVITNFEVAEKSRLESNEARTDLMARSFLAFEPWPETVERLNRLRLITTADVLRVAQRYLGPDRVVAFRRNAKPEIPNITKPPFTHLEIDDTRQSAFAAEILALPAIPPQPKWLEEGRDYSVMTPPWGKLYAVPNPVNDLFSITLAFERGSRHERKLCAALSLLELSGAGDLTAEEFKKRLFALGASIGYSCGEQESGASVSGLNENLWPSLELMLRRFEDPRIATDTLKKMVEVAIGAHQDNKRNPDYVHHALGEYALRGKESSVLSEMSDQELLALKTPELRKLIVQALGTKRRAAYVGNRPPGEIAKLLDSDRRFKEPPPRKPQRYLKPPRTRLFLAHRDMVQSQVGIAAADGVFDPQSKVDYDFYGNYMGGGMSSVIFQEIREARSLAYAAWGGYRNAAYRGDENQVFGVLGCQADKTREATELLDRLLRAPPLSESRFRETAKAMEENYRTNPIPFRGISGALMTWEDQGIAGGDPRPRRFEKVLKYRLEDLKAFAQRFKDRPMTIYILGHRDRLDLESLKKLGELEVRKLEDLFPY